jgi:hypothetical protein
VPKGEAKRVIDEYLGTFPEPGQQRAFVDALTEASPPYESTRRHYYDYSGIHAALGEVDREVRSAKQILNLRQDLQSAILREDLTAIDDRLKGLAKGVSWPGGWTDEGRIAAARAAIEELDPIEGLLTDERRDLLVTAALQKNEENRNNLESPPVRAWKALSKAATAFASEKPIHSMDLLPVLREAAEAHFAVEQLMPSPMTTQRIISALENLCTHIHAWEERHGSKSYGIRADLLLAALKSGGRPPELEIPGGFEWNGSFEDWAHGLRSVLKYQEWGWLFELFPGICDYKDRRRSGALARELLPELRASSVVRSFLERNPDWDERLTNYATGHQLQSVLRDLDGHCSRLRRQNPVDYRELSTSISGAQALLKDELLPPGCPSAKHLEAQLEDLQAAVKESGLKYGADLADLFAGYSKEQIAAERTALVPELATDVDPESGQGRAHAFLMARATDNEMETERLLAEALRRAEARRPWGSEFADEVRRLSPGPLDEKLELRLEDIAQGGRLTKVEGAAQRLTEPLRRGASVLPGDLLATWSELGSLWRATESSRPARDFIEKIARDLHAAMKRFEEGKAASLPGYGEAADWYLQSALDSVDRDRWEWRLKYLEAASPGEIFRDSSSEAAKAQALRFIQALVLGNGQDRHWIMMQNKEALRLALRDRRPVPALAEFANLVRGEQPELVAADPQLDFDPDSRSWSTQSSRELAAAEGQLDFDLADMSLGGEPSQVIQHLNEIPDRFAGKPGWDKTGVSGPPPGKIFERASACLQKARDLSPEVTRRLLEAFHPAFDAFSTWQNDAQEASLFYELGGISPILEASGLEAMAKASGLSD